MFFPLTYSILVEVSQCNFRYQNMDILAKVLHVDKIKPLYLILNKLYVFFPPKDEDQALRELAELEKEGCLQDVQDLRLKVEYFLIRCFNIEQNNLKRKDFAVSNNGIMSCVLHQSDPRHVDPRGGSRSK